MSPLMTQGEVAEAFRVGIRQPSRWAKNGLIKRVMTPGGQPRYLRDEIEALLVRGAMTPPFLQRITEQR